MHLLRRSHRLCFTTHSTVGNVRYSCGAQYCRSGSAEAKILWCFHAHCWSSAGHFLGRIRPDCPPRQSSMAVYLNAVQRSTQKYQDTCGDLNAWWTVMTVFRRAVLVLPYPTKHLPRRNKKCLRSKNYRRSESPPENYREIISAVYHLILIVTWHCRSWTTAMSHYHGSTDAANYSHRQNTAG